jgi:carbon-monoxide dehydrogenase large subunit
MTNSSSTNGIGAPVRRTEDVRLVTGRGLYTADVFPDGLTYAAVIRSPHAHADIGAIVASAAMAIDGVHAVLTGADAAADGLKPIPHNAEYAGGPDAVLNIPDGFEVFAPEHHALPQHRVRYVGEPVAIVIAETEALALDAAEAVEIEYAPLPAVTDARAARKSGAPQIWDACAGNLSLTCEVGDKDAADAAFENAAHVVKFDTWVNRITGAPMEPRAVIGEYDAARDFYTVRTASGRGAVQTRERMAYMLGAPLENARAVFGDMGGNFGTRNAFFPEALLMPWAAKRVGRPVKWIASRSECFLSDYQGRDLAVTAELALDADGSFLGLRGVNTSNLGAYTAYYWPLRKGLSLMQSVYNIPELHFEGHAVFTNTAPTAVYRSAGRPEAIYVIERLIDLAATQCGFDRADLRRRNLIAADAMPFTTAVGVTYDSGDYTDAMDQALEAADWAGYAARKAESASRGLCRGIGIANYIEVTSGIPRERAEIRILADGIIELVAGTMSSGQGHETSYAQVLSDWLEVPFECIRYIDNDTNRVTVGGGSHSGRSMRLVSIAIDHAIKDLLAKGKAIAGHLLQAPEGAITYASGIFTGPGGGVVTLAEAANTAATLNSLPADLSGHFEGVGDIVNRDGGFPYGTHVCEVEADPETGYVQVLSWTGVDDVGRAINPLILHGQAHGAIAQGLGQALLEGIHYETDSAQLLTGSFMDYAMPRADVTPPMNTIISEVPSTSHPHGVRPGGEGGTTPALGLVVNAIVDALKDHGVKHIEMPATPERVWRAIQAGKAS